MPSKVSVSSLRVHDAVSRVTVASLFLLAFASQAAASNVPNSSWKIWSRNSMSALQLRNSSGRTSLRMLAATYNSSLAVGSKLHAYDQCGGAGGLCNQTTIGIPCGDHVWEMVYCPANFTCQRVNQKYWQCQLMPGRTAPADATVVNATVAVTVLPATTEAGNSTALQEKGNLTASNSNSKNNSSNGTEQVHAPADEPIVPVCGPGAMPGQSAMCAKTQTRYILPLDQIPDASSAAAAGRYSSSIPVCLLQLLCVVLAIAVAAVQ